MRIKNWIYSFFPGKGKQCQVADTGSSSESVVSKSLQDSEPLKCDVSYFLGYIYLKDYLHG